MKKSRAVRKSITVAGLIALTFVLLLSNHAHADANNNTVTTWAKTFDGIIWQAEKTLLIQPTSDRGYIVAGSKQSSRPDRDILILKLDSNGHIIWQKTYGGDNFDDVVSSIQQTSDGGYIVAGITASFGSGGLDAWLLKLDSNGFVEWQKSYGASGFEYTNFVRQTLDNGFIVSGYSYSFGRSWIFKVDAAGNLQWQKTYGVGWHDFLGPIQQTTDGGYIVVGNSWEVIGNTRENNGDVLALKLDSSGNIQWQKVYGGAKYDFANSILQATDGGYVLAGATMSFGAGDRDAWVLKLDQNGSIEWQKTYGGNNPDYIYSIQRTSDDGYIMVGGTSSFEGGPGWIVKLDTSGSIQWQKVYGSKARGFFTFDIQQVIEDGYIVVGSMAAGGLLLKLDDNGNISGCAGSFIKDSDATVMNAAADARNINLSVYTGYSSSHITGAVIRNANIAMLNLCDEAWPGISINPLSLNFSSVELPGSSSQAVIVSNIGNADLSVNSITISGLNAEAFAQTSNCLRLAPNASCTVTVTFSPTSLGAKSATLNISSNDPNTPTVNIPLAGTGIDTIPPSVSMTISDNILWPPNHKMVDVLIGGFAVDTGSGVDSVVITVTDKYGVYNMTVPGFGSTIQLEAWREGTDMDGRHYTITAVVTDKAGNQSTATTEVLVPHDMR